MKKLIFPFLVVLLAASAPSQELPPAEAPPAVGVGASEPAEPESRPAVPEPRTVFKPTPEGQPGPDHSVFRVTVTSQRWHPRLPWSKLAPSSRRGLGTLLKNNRILVTAQMVANATYVEIERPDSGRKRTGKVLGLDYELNLALLQVDGDADGFFDGMVPMEIDDGARIGDENLNVWQMEDDGTPVVTETLLREVDVEPYAIPRFGGLVFKLSGLLGEVGSGFTVPVARDGKLAGMLLRYDGREQVITLLPAPIIRRFLEDLDQPPYEGLPNLGLKYDSLLDEQLRDYHKVPKDVTNGVLVTEVLPRTTSEAAGVKEGDVVLKINGFEISARGDYQDPDYGHLKMANIILGHAKVGGEVRLDILREGKPMELKAVLKGYNQADELVEDYRYDRGPDYVIFGGMVFLELTTDYLLSFGREWRDDAPFELVYMAAHQEKYEKDRKRVVFLSRVLPGDGTQGYENLGSLVLTKVNGAPVGSLKDLAALLDKPPQDGIHKIEFTSSPYEIFLSDEQAKKDDKILLPMVRAASPRNLDP